MEAGGVVAPDGAPQVERLVEPVTPVVEVLAQHLELAGGPPDAHAQGEPATRERVEARQRVGQLERRVLGHHQHAGAEPDVLGDRGRPGERDERVEQVRRRVVLGRGLHDVVAHPHPRVAELLGMTRACWAIASGPLTRPYCGRWMPKRMPSPCQTQVRSGGGGGRAAGTGGDEDPGRAGRGEGTGLGGARRPSRRGRGVPMEKIDTEVTPLVDQVKGERPLARRAR